MDEPYRIAIYLRLSKEDGESAEESNSITNQRMLLKEYVKKHFGNYRLKEFADDGFSGTNFQRPGVSKMLEQIRNGEIDCVLVKDFSRFSRDYIELGSYLDQIFPFLGIRFISLNDNYDSKKQDGGAAELDISFKGLMYDLYSKDLSVKVKSSLRTRKEQGQYACSIPPFGYKKADGDRHMLTEAEEEAKIVRKIFSLALEGKTSVEIARLLNLEKIPAPIEFKIRKKQADRTPPGNSFRWNHTAVCSILKNPVYTGDMVYNKYEKSEVGGKNHLKPRSEWKVYQNHHAPIVSRADFEKVQKMRERAGSRRAKDVKAGKEKEVGVCHPLQGKVFCGGCRRAMTLRKHVRHPYFYCNHRYAYTDRENCVSHLKLVFLEQFVLEQLRFRLPAQKELEKIRQEKEDEIRKKLHIWIKEKEKISRKKAALQRKRLEEYEKSVFHREISFQTEDLELQQVEERMAEIEKEIISMEQKLREEKDKSSFSREGKAELTKELAETLIREITVYGEERIEITWTL
ncbi:MAG: recombinase family protein [Lachnospiraceae bacterium]|nr:recombinase family protein [Lachnospiraceae bacterium]